MSLTQIRVGCIVLSEFWRFGKRARQVTEVSCVYSFSVLSTDGVSIVATAAEICLTLADTEFPFDASVDETGAPKLTSARCRCVDDRIDFQ